MKKTRKWLIPSIIVLVVALGVGGFFYYRNAQAKKATASSAPQQIVQVQTGTLTASIGATGSVRAAQSTLVNWNSSGTVAKVQAKLGDKVTSGQELAILDPSTAPQALIQAQADLITAQTNLDNLKNPTPLAVAQAQSAVDTAQTNLDSLQSQYQINLAQASANLAIAQTNLSNAKTNRDSLNYQTGSQAAIDSTWSQITNTQRQIISLQDQFTRVIILGPDDPKYARAYSALVTAQTNLANQQRLYNFLMGKGSPSDITTADGNLAVAQAALTDAQKKLDDLKPGIKPSDLALAQAQVQDAQTTLANLKNPKPADIAAAQARVDAIQSELNQILVQAPFAGTITDINLLVGDIVASGTNAFRIDNLSAMYIDLQVSEVDINSVKVGQAVEIAFDAIPDKTYQGQVTEAGAAGTTSSGVVNFPVTVKLTDADAAVKPGMTASANVITSSISNALLVPTRAIHTVNNKSTVTLIATDGTTQPVTVQLGASNDTQTQIVSGVKAGDRVVIGATTATPTGGGGGFGGGGIGRAFGN
jgi:HlyD family secretion protein